MTWTSLLQAGSPYLVFTTLEKSAYLDYFGQEKTEDSPETREHFDEELKTWERLMNVNLFTWGPLVILGAMNLSEFMGSLTAVYYEWIWSNFYLPAYLIGFYLMIGNAIRGQTRLDTWAFLGYAFSAFSIFTTQTATAI